MNNKTRIRLHLSKNLFESIAKEVLTEAKKANDGYTVAVKQPKMPKQSKSQATSPEVQKTDAEANQIYEGEGQLKPEDIKMGETYLYVQTGEKYGQTSHQAPVKVKVASAINDQWFNVEALEDKEGMKKGQKYKAEYTNLHPVGTSFGGFNQTVKEAGAPPMPPVPGKSAVDKLNLAGANIEIKDAKTFAKAILDIAEKLKSKEGFKPESNPSIKRAMDALRTVSSGAPAVPPAGQDKPSQYQKPKMPPVPGQMKEMEMNVAEEGQLNEIDPSTIDWSAVAAGLGAIGLAPLAIDKIHDMWKKKFPKSFGKAQGLSGAIDKQASGN